MAVQRLVKGAYRKGAPFAFLQGAIFLLALLFSTALDACSLDRSDARVEVAYVYDGDTFKLSDGRKVRFIGINTPEINHDGGPSDPFAQAARKRLQQLIGDSEVLLRFGPERHDRYGRLLAHPYLSDGRSLSMILLREGLAAVVAIPPNLWQSDCYLQAEQTARAAGLGIWSVPESVIRHSRSLRRGNEGFALLRGRIEVVDESRNSLWLELEGNAALRIPKSSLHYFDSYDPRQLAGRDVEARGWLTYYKGKWRMQVRHPNAMALTPR